MKYPSWREEGSAAPARVAAKQGQATPAGVGWEGLPLGLERKLLVENLYELPGIPRTPGHRN